MSAKRGPGPHVAPESTDAALLDRLEQLSRPSLKAPEAARYIGTSLSTFKKMAPSLPRCRLGDNSYVYLKRDLLSHLERVREEP